MKITDANKKELFFYRDYVRKDNGLGCMTLTIRDDADKEVAKAHRDTIKAIFPGESGVLSAKWTDQLEVALISPGGEAHFTAQTHGGENNDLSKIESTFPANPPGHNVLTYTWDGADSIVIEAKMLPSPATPGKPTAPTVEPQGSDEIPDNIPEADLMTKCAENGVKYDSKKFNRAKALKELRDKLQPAGV